MKACKGKEALKNLTFSAAAPLEMAARSLALLCSLRILVQDKHISNWANAELLLPATSLPVLVNTLVKQQVSICAEALFGCSSYMQSLGTIQRHLLPIVTKKIHNSQTLELPP